MMARCLMASTAPSSRSTSSSARMSGSLRRVSRGQGMRATTSGRPRVIAIQEPDGAEVRAQRRGHEVLLLGEVEQERAYVALAERGRRLLAEGDETPHAADVRVD